MRGWTPPKGLVSSATNRSLEERTKPGAGASGPNRGQNKDGSSAEEKGRLIEVNTDKAATWIKNGDNMRTFCKAIGGSVVHRSRTFNVMAFNVSLTFNSGNQTHLDEIHKVNHISKEGVAHTRWTKSPDKRWERQKMSHLILSFIDVDLANRAISNRLTICNQRMPVEKIRRSPQDVSGVKGGTIMQMSAQRATSVPTAQKTMVQISAQYLNIEDVYGVVQKVTPAEVENA